MKAFSFRTYETEAGESLSARLAWSVYQAPGQPELHNKTLYQKKINDLTCIHSLLTVWWQGLMYPRLASYSSSSFNNLYILPLQILPHPNPLFSQPRVIGICYIADNILGIIIGAPDHNACLCILIHIHIQKKGHKIHETRRMSFFSRLC